MWLRDRRNLPARYKTAGKEVSQRCFARRATQARCSIDQTIIRKEAPQKFFVEAQAQQGRTKLSLGFAHIVLVPLSAAKLRN